MVWAQTLKAKNIPMGTRGGQGGLGGKGGWGWSEVHRSVLEVKGFRIPWLGGGAYQRNTIGYDEIKESRVFSMIERCVVFVTKRLGKFAMWE